MWRQGETFQSAVLLSGLFFPSELPVCCRISLIVYMIKKTANFKHVLVTLYLTILCFYTYPGSKYCYSKLGDQKKINGKWAIISMLFRVQGSILFYVQIPQIVKQVGLGKLKTDKRILIVQISVQHNGNTKFQNSSITSAICSELL